MRRDWLTRNVLQQAKDRVGVNEKILNNTLDEEREFIRAVAYGNICIVNQLINKHPEWAHLQRHSTGDFPLHIAASNGKTSVVRRLLALGADQYCINNAGESILMSALLPLVISENYTLVELLLDAGCDPLVRDQVAFT